MTKKITLYIENDQGEEVEKTFHQPARIKGKAARVGLQLGKKMESLENGMPGDDLIDEMLQFIAEYGYNAQFTADDLENGLDARDFFQALSGEVQAVLQRTDDEAKGKSDLKTVTSKN